MLRKPRRTSTQEINSSSMSDIAFLLLVFFLVTTTISLDKGISLILPAEGNELEVNRKNITSILINDKGKVLMDDNPIKINQIKSPLLIFSGKKDEVVPHFHSQLLYDKANKQKSLFIKRDFFCQIKILVSSSP